MLGTLLGWNDRTSAGPLLGTGEGFVLGSKDVSILGMILGFNDVMKLGVIDG